MLVSLTGEHFGPFGESMPRGFNLARDEINSTSNLPIAINLIPIDDMSTAQRITEAFENLIEMDFLAIVGVAISSGVLVRTLSLGFQSAGFNNGLDAQRIGMTATMPVNVFPVDSIFTS